MDLNDPITVDTQRFAFALVLNNLTLPTFMQLPMERQVSISVRAGLTMPAATLAVAQLNELIKLHIGWEMMLAKGSGEHGSN
jgi:hypothetical protein